MSRKHHEPKNDFDYLTGFGNYFSSEHPNYKGALPHGQNYPQRCKFGLYAEQLSGSAFTAPQKDNFRSILYRIRPSVLHAPFDTYKDKYPGHYFQTRGIGQSGVSKPNQLRWLPLESDEKLDFLQSLKTYAGAGDPATRNGIAIHMYAARKSMDKTALYNSDGDFLIVPQQGMLYVTTEMGRLLVMPGEILIIPQGIRFKVDLTDENQLTRGYILEIWNGHFELPNLGPIGANGLALKRDFLTPTAWFEDTQAPWQIVSIFHGELFVSKQNHSPFDVVAWHGNYAPYKYDLGKFMAFNSVTFDHADPSIFTVLTCPSAKPGTAVADFVVFSPRWSVSENTFRPPYYHRNCMSEYMGLIYGEYEAKPTQSGNKLPGGFYPGGCTLHPMMTSHGPDVNCFLEASKPIEGGQKPVRVADGCLAFMFETSFSLLLTPWAAGALDEQEAPLDKDYNECWQLLPKLFPVTS
ncbi:hypothetical protein Ciccas_011870 [Cichlidogyrus casuarinus]|uniref:Homogentisate 1,2-dioxygenase n=1 Tax=Cichlidogyrus casuarinus TaxID=1844966 RepID=A0ABD2PR97_9PLAT